MRSGVSTTEHRRRRLGSEAQSASVRAFREQLPSAKNKLSLAAGLALCRPGPRRGRNDRRRCLLIGKHPVRSDQNLRYVSGKANSLAVDDDNLSIVVIALCRRQSVRNERSCAGRPVTTLDWLVDRGPGQRTDHVPPIAVFLPPTRSMGEKEFGQLGIAAEYSEVQCGCFPVPTACVDRPAQRTTMTRAPASDPHATVSGNSRSQLRK